MIIKLKYRTNLYRTMDLDIPGTKTFLGPATIWKRILALLLDLFIIDFFIISSFRDLISRVTGSSTAREIYRMVDDNTPAIKTLIMAFSIIIILALAYFTLLQYLLGQTLGQMMLDIYVVDSAQPDAGTKEPPMLWQCILRNLFIIPVAPFIFIWAVDPLYMLFTRSDQRLTEWLSNTKVVERFIL